MRTLFDGYWNWFFGDTSPNYPIAGKYLFFSEDKSRLFSMAKNEIENHGFFEAKVNARLLRGQTEYVLCLYYRDDSRKHELAERNNEEYHVKYRFWKSDEATLRGQYSSEFLGKLSQKDRAVFEKKLAK